MSVLPFGFQLVMSRITIWVPKVVLLYDMSNNNSEEH